MNLIRKYLPNRKFKEDEVIDIWNFTKFKPLISGNDEIPHEEVEKVYEYVGLKYRGNKGPSLHLKVNDKDDVSMVAPYGCDFSYADIETINEGKRISLLQESIVSNEMKNKGDEKFGFFPWEPWLEKKEEVKRSYEIAKAEFSKPHECKTIRGITYRLSKNYLKSYNLPWTLPGNV
jgi:hypothetical protein